MTRIPTAKPNGFNMSSDIAKSTGSSLAYQSVSQSMSIAVQDSTDHLRDVQTIIVTALGVAAAKYAAGDGQMAKVLEKLPTLVPDAAKNFVTIGKDAAEILGEFPSS